jgi:hypothetical protein
MKKGKTSLCENLEVKLAQAELKKNDEKAWHLKSVECIFESSRVEQQPTQSQHTTYNLCYACFGSIKTQSEFCEFYFLLNPTISILPSIHSLTNTSEVLTTQSVSS